VFGCVRVMLFWLYVCVGCLVGMFAVCCVDGCCDWFGFAYCALWVYCLGFAC